MCVCVDMASASLAAGISQSRDRTCCLSGRRVAIVTLSASLRCFWETIPHPNQAVWVPATGHSSFFSPSQQRPCPPLFPFLCLLSPSSSLWTQSESSGSNRWPRSALWGRGKNKPKRESVISVFLKLDPVCAAGSSTHTHSTTCARHAKLLASPGDPFWLGPCVTSPHLNLRFPLLIALPQSRTPTLLLHTPTQTSESFCSEQIPLPRWFKIELFWCCLTYASLCTDPL